MTPDSVAPRTTDDEPSSLGSVIDLWLDATAWCGGTRVGTVCGFVCSSRSPHLRDIVVRSDARPHVEHPVARRDIAGTDRGGVTIDLPPDVVRARSFATDTVIVDDLDPVWWTELETGSPDPWLLHREPLHIPVAVPRLDPGDVLIRPHAAVYAQQHHLGRLSGLRVDGDSGRVTACIVDVGHRWHHRHVLVPAAAIEELSEMIVRVRGTRQEMTHMPEALDRQANDLIPEEPRDAGVDDGDPDAAHSEAAHLLADEAHDALRQRGFTDSEIRHWADAYVRAERSGDADDFLAWIDVQEHGH